MAFAISVQMIVRSVRSRSSLGLGALVLGLVGLWTANGMAAAADDHRLRQYVHTAWTLGDGAPPDIWHSSNRRMAICGWGRGDGRRPLFASTASASSACARSPGVTFPATDITALMSTPSGALWIGYQDGGVSQLKDGKLTNYREGVLSEPTNSFASTGDGAVWVGTGGRARAIFRWPLAVSQSGAGRSARGDLQSAGRAGWHALGDGR
ncbi:MAG: hypothetical protein WDN08_20090 [Rhizomicrobium sp.]